MLRSQSVYRSHRKRVPIVGKQESAAGSHRLPAPTLMLFNVQPMIGGGRRSLGVVERSSGSSRGGNQPESQRQPLLPPMRFALLKVGHGSQPTVWSEDDCRLRKAGSSARVRTPGNS